MGVDHLDTGSLDRFVRRQARTERANPLVSAAIGQGGLRIHDGGKITVENGGLVIGGTESISGVWILTGTGVVYGAFQIDGDFVVNTVGALFNGELIATSGLSLFGLPTTSSPANMRRTSLGIVQEVTSAARYKIDPQTMNLPDSLMDIPVQWWIDLADAEVLSHLLYAPRPLTRQQQAAFDGASFRRVPGVIAETVEACGGAPFVDYDSDGNIKSVFYDRLAVGQVAVVWRNLVQLQAEFADARAEIAALRNELADIHEQVRAPGSK